MPLFSVIITTYDRPEFLKQAVDSVLAQTISDFECIIVDDAGSIPAAAPADPRVRVIRHSINRGEPASRNTGLENAKGRYVTFLDDDDVFTPDRLEIALLGLDRAPLAICWRGGLLDGSTFGNRKLEGDVSEIIVNGLTPQMGQVAVVRELAGTFDERFQALTDVEWWLRTGRGLKVTAVPRVGLKYRTHSGPRNRNGQIVRVKCSLLLLDVHHDYFQARPRAAAFRWKRIGIMSAALGDYALAREALLRSLRLKVQGATIKHLLASMKRSTVKLEISEDLLTPMKTLK